MKDLELRLALVCYGGSSLAVYMNGLTTEFLSAVRASTALDRPQMLNPALPLSGTGQLYKELLERLAPKRRINLVIDVISGTSAGGLNGIFLSRALAHDLSLDPLRDMWLELGDIEKLMEGYSLANRVSKIYMQPAIYLLERSIKGYRDFDPEMKRKLNRFFRSRWLKPPFSGETMLRWMIEAGYGMGEAGQLAAGKRYSLMPTGHQLDLFVSVTNFFGEPRSIALDNPEFIEERAHGKSLHFHYLRRLSGDGHTDFHDGNVPGLGFAARATSSYPGAFPPTSLREVDRKLTRLGRSWTHKPEFLQANFGDQLARDNGLEELRDMQFLDGGIINNKPFSDAIRALVKRPAQKPVDRRVLFIDPLPASHGDPVPDRKPGFFETILGGAVNIPLSQPIYDDLRRITRHNQTCRREETLIKAIKNDVSALLHGMVQLDEQAEVTPDLLRHWRLEGSDLAYNRSGFAAGAYHHARLTNVFQQLTTLITGLMARAGRSVDQDDVDQLVFRWAGGCGLISSEVLGVDAGVRLQQLLDFLAATDVRFRLRRLRRVLGELNALSEADDLSDTLFTKVKRRLYLGVEQCQAKLNPDRYPAGLLADLPSGKLGEKDIECAIECIQAFIKLDGLDFEIDRYLAAVLDQMPKGDTRQRLFQAYVGFAFEDMMMMGLMSDASGEERQVVRVGRISPLDSGWMTNDQNPLMGSALFNFGAFFSRRARENDYLWGRLHSADRMVDLILSAAGPDAVPDDLDVSAFKRLLFRTVLKEERNRMTEITDVLEDLRLRFRE